MENAQTTAQLFTRVAYTDSTRALQYKVECRDAKDFRECINIIKSYNDFNALDVNRYFDKLSRKVAYFNAGNPNNGKDLFDFTVGRENSPVIYVKYSTGNQKQNIINLDSGRVEDYSGDDFINDMRNISESIKADEFSIEEDTKIGSFRSITVRMWFD